MKTSVTLGFAYDARYSVAGARGQIELPLRATDTAVVRSVSPEEAPVAFRVTMPETDMSFLISPRKLPRETPGLSRPSISLEIVAHDGQLWWPHLQRFGNFGVRLLSRDELVAAVADDHGRIGRHAAPEAEIMAAGTILESDRDSRLAIARKSTFENYLIRGAAAYVRAGAPVFYKNKHGQRSTWQIDVGSAHAGRCNDPRADIPGSPQAVLNGGAVETALCAGEFWTPAEADEAQRASHSIQKVLPRIEICPDQSVFPSKEQLRLDAIFWKAKLLIASEVPYAAAGPGIIAEFSELAADDRMPELSCMRHRLVERLFATKRPLDYKLERLGSEFGQLARTQNSEIARSGALEGDFPAAVSGG